MIDYTFDAEQFLLIGKIAKAHGLRGEVKIFLYSGQPENVCAYRELFLVDVKGKISPPLKVVKSRMQGKSTIMLLGSFGSRTEAERLEGMGVLLARKHLPPVADGEYYWHQYQNKAVERRDGEIVGTVHHIFNNGAHDILVIGTDRGEILIPVTKEVVIGETEDRLTIDPPPGLLDINKDSDD